MSTDLSHRRWTELSPLNRTLSDEANREANREANVAPTELETEADVPSPAEELTLGKDQLKGITGILQFVAGLSAVGILNPPGGVGADGFARFYHKPAYAVFFLSADLAFLTAVLGIVYLTSRTPKNANGCKSLIQKGWYFFTVCASLLLIAFLSGIFLIIPVKHSVLPVCAIIIAVGKIVCSIWARCSAA